MGNVPIDQHFLPRFYLRRFGADDAVRIRRRDGAHFVTGTAAVGHERTMYDHPRLPKGAVESGYLQHVDARAAQALSTIDDDGVPALGHEGRWDLAHYLAVQMSRTPERREQVAWPIRLRAFADGRALTRDLVAEYLREVHLGFEPQQGEVDGAYELASHLPGTQDEYGQVFLRMVLVPPQEVVETLFSMSWVLEIARKPRFITSDSPIVLWRTPTVRDEFEGIGLANADEVRFPLDTGKQLVLKPPAVGDGHQWVEPARVRNCNQDMSYGSLAFIVGHPQREVQLSNLELPAHRPLLRFNCGPLVEISDEGTRRTTGREVVHVWSQRR